MAKYAIKHSDGTVVAYTHKLTHNDNMMGECFVTASIKSPSVIAWALGDYVDYRGRRYYMAVTPSVQKQARVNTVGNAIVYDSIKFTSAAGYDMVRCEFRDVVLLSQASVQHTNFAARTFNFYCDTLVKFGERLQANLNRLFTGDDKWEVYVRMENGNDHLCNGGTPASTPLGKKDVTVSIGNQTCWDALAHVKDDFNSFFMVSDKIVSGKNVKKIVLGTSGTVVPHYFRYGKDNGVFKFERTADDSQAVVTVLRAYGNTTNVPRGYYQKKGLDATLNVQNLMMPVFAETGLDGYMWHIMNESKYAATATRIKNIVNKYFGYTPQDVEHLRWYVGFSTDKNDPYIYATKQREKYGNREGCVVFDGTGEYEDIHPSIEWLGETNKIAGADQMIDDGTAGESGTPEVETFQIWANLGFNPAEQIPYGSDSFTVHFNSGMLGGRDFECIAVEKQQLEGSNLYYMTLKRTEDTSLNLWFPYKDFNAKAGDEYVLTGINMPDLYVDDTAKMELLPRAIEVLFDNCDVRYKYSLTVDNINMQRQHDDCVKNNKPNESVYNTIKAGDELWFGDEDLGFNFDTTTQQVTGHILIDKLEIKEEDGKLPQYSITLVDEIQVGTIEAIQKQIDAITSGKTAIGGGGYNSADIQNIVRALGDARYLKLTGGTVNGDVGVAGNMTVNGDATVTGTLHVTKLTADTIEVMEAKHIAGKVISSPAGMVIQSVEEVTDGWKCYFPKTDEDGNDVNNMFAVNDQAFCEQFEVNADADYVTSKVWWRLIKEVGTDENGHYIVVSSKNGEYKELWSDIPEEGDNVIVLGSQTDEDRQGAMISSPVGSFVYESQTYPAPYECQYNGINTFELPDPVNVKSPKLTIVKADKIELTSGGDYDGFTIYVVDWAAETYTDEQGEAHGVSPYAADAVEPSASWETTTYNSHIGDFLVTTNGFCYRFVLTGEGVYEWEIIADELLIKVQEQIKGIQQSGFVTKEDYAKMWAGVYDPDTGEWLTNGAIIANTYFSTALNRWVSQVKISANDIKFSASDVMSVSAGQLLIDTPQLKLTEDKLAISLSNFTLTESGEITAKNGKFYGTLYSEFADTNDLVHYDKVTWGSYSNFVLPSPTSNIGRRISIYSPYVDTRTYVQANVTVEGNGIIYGLSCDIDLTEGNFYVKFAKKVSFVGGVMEFLCTSDGWVFVGGLSTIQYVKVTDGTTEKVYCYGEIQ